MNSTRKRERGALTRVAGGKVPAELADAIAAYAKAARAENTSRAYAGAWARFTVWCASQGLSALPAAPSTVAAWIAAAGQGVGGAKPLSRSTINQSLSAIVLAHRHAGFTLDRRSAEIAEMWAGMSRRKAQQGAVTRKVKPVMGDELRDLVLALSQDRPADVRDAALFTIGWAGALRRAELVGLDWQKPGRGTGYLSLEDRGLVVTLNTSKGSQAEAAAIAIPCEDMPTACDALARWVKLAKIRPGQALFRRVTNTGAIGADRLTDGSVARIIKSRLARHLRNGGRSPAEATALAEAFSAHSLRAGYATTAGENEVADHRIQQRMRHRSMDTTAGYIRSGRQWTKSGLRAIGPDGKERSIGF